MCSLMALPFIGAGIGAAGAYYEGRSKENYYNTLAGQKDVEAGETLRAGAQNEQSVRADEDQALVQTGRKGRQVAASQRVAMAVNGVQGGTAEDVMRDSFERMSEDEMAIRHSADMKASEINRDANWRAYDLRSQASMARTAGKQARVGALFGMGTSLVSGATQAANMYRGK